MSNPFSALSSLPQITSDAEREQLRAAERQRNKAKVLIYQAASLLGELGEEERRIAWLLEDCIELMNPVDEYPA